MDQADRSPDSKRPSIARSPSRSCSAARRGPSPSSTARWRRRSASACGLWIAGLLLWAIGHLAAVWAAKRDRRSSMWCGVTSATPRISVA